MPKTRVNISLDDDLADFMRGYASYNRTTVSEVINQFALSLKRKAQGIPTEQVLADPAVEAAMVEVKEKLRKGTMKFYSHEEVFGE